MSGLPITKPRLICSGWWRDPEMTARVHDEVRVLREGPADQPPSHGACAECRAAFLRIIPKLPDVDRRGPADA